MASALPPVPSLSFFNASAVPLANSSASALALEAKNLKAETTINADAAAAVKPPVILPALAAAF